MTDWYKKPEPTNEEVTFHNEYDCFFYDEVAEVDESQIEMLKRFEAQSRANAVTEEHRPKSCQQLTNLSRSSNAHNNIR